MNNIEIIKQLFSRITLADVFYFIGILSFSRWLLKYSFGTTALKDSTERHNSMPIYTPFIPILTWFALSAAVSEAIKTLYPGREELQYIFFNNIVFCFSTIIMSIVTILIVRNTFTDRLKGFGLNPKTILKDFAAAVVNIISVYPLIILVFLTTIFVGQLIFGPDFQIHQHQQLKSIASSTQWSVKILIAVVSILIVPAFEEMIFRGLLQTMMRSLTKKPWLAIMISSSIFATIHAQPSHWPALFVLAICLGYSYEKSGSLFRAIFIHSIFNAISVISVLNQ